MRKAGWLLSVLLLVVILAGCAFVSTSDSAVTEWPPSMTVKLGTYVSNEALRQALIGAGFRIGRWGDDILKRVKVASKPTAVKIKIVTVAELGFPDGATRIQIYQKALSLGLQLCAAEVGPAMRLQYRDQPKGEWLLIGMEPIIDSNGYPGVFNLASVFGKRWLCSPFAFSDDFWSDFWPANCRWAFRCP
jgi:hypothetical protein